MFISVRDVKVSDIESFLRCMTSKAKNTDKKERTWINGVAIEIVCFQDVKMLDEHGFLRRGIKIKASEFEIFVLPKRVFFDTCIHALTASLFFFLVGEV